MSIAQIGYNCIVDTAGRISMLRDEQPEEDPC